MDNIELNRLHEQAGLGIESAIIALVNHYLSIGKNENAFMVAQRLVFVSSVEGYKLLASFYLKGIGTKEDVNKAKSLYQKALALGDLDSGYNLALIALKQNSDEEAIKYLLKGADKNHGPSLKLLAMLYIRNNDSDKAITLLTNAVENGEKSSADILAKLYYSKEDYDNAFKYFLIGAELKNLDSIYHLGLCYAKGLGTKQNFALARKQYEIGANLLEPRCLYNLSLYYRNGITIDKNLELANKLERQAIENGFKK